MLTSIVLFMLAWPPRYTEAQADAIVLAIVESDQDIPDDLTADLGAALVRLWRREELWGDFPAPSGWHLRHEIIWTRTNWHQSLPPLAELERLPSADEVARSREVLAAMRCDLERLAEVIPEWNRLAITLRRAEIDEADCFFTAVANARADVTTPIYRRQRLQEIRAMVGDRKWFAGDWPTIPWWQFPVR